VIIPELAIVPGENNIVIRSAERCLFHENQCEAAARRESGLGLCLHRTLHQPGGCALHKSDVDIPSEFSGVLWISMDATCT